MITTTRRRRAALAVATLVVSGMVATTIGPRPVAALVNLPMNVDGFQDGVYVPIDDVLLGGSGGAPSSPTATWPSRGRAPS